MTANELRIGNYIDECNIAFLQATILDIECILNGDTNYYPIELTEYWLFKFGFEAFKFDNGEKNQYRLDSRLIVIRNGFFTDYGTSVKLQYVHQLQNLYFALTNKELTYNE